MVWSISESRGFRQCQRRWYFKNFVANAVAKKDPVRREAYLLSKLQSISAWRGQIVDLVISDTLVPALNARRRVTLADLKQRAKYHFDTQLACARAHRLWEAGVSPSQLGDRFAAFYCVEYGGTINEEEVTRAWAEIECALENLCKMQELSAELKTARYIITQRALQFKHSDMTVRAVPDLIAFFDDAPPLIVDWKVHVFGLQEAWLQLSAYAVALVRCGPHNDFPSDLSRYRETDVRLAEAQLLTNQLRRFVIGEDEVMQVDSYIAESVVQMQLATEGRRGAELTADDFAVTSSPDLCQRCPFRKLCWKELP
jgi:hypothetical protein